MNRTLSFTMRVDKIALLAILTGTRGVGGKLTPASEHERSEEFRNRARAANLAVRARNNGTYDATRRQSLSLNIDQVYFDSYRPETRKVTVDRWDGFVVADAKRVRVHVR